MEKIITIDGVKYRCTPVEEEHQEEKRISGYYIAADATISHSVEVPDTPNNYNIFATEKLAKRALAMARISQIMANDERFGGTITDEERKDFDVEKWTIQRENNTISLSLEWDDEYYYFMAFHTRQQAKLFLQENEDIIKDYFMLD